MSYADLKLSIDDAINVLAPLFGILPEERLQFHKHTLHIVDKLPESRDDGAIFRAKYDFDECAFTFTEAVANDTCVIGHEVTHFLHNECNPSVRKDGFQDGCPSFNYWKHIELTEMIAEYGGVVYSYLKGKPVSLSNSFFLTSTNGMSGQLYTICATNGYKRANVAFQLYAQTKMQYTINLSLTESINILPQVFPITIYERKILPHVIKIKQYFHL